MCNWKPSHKENSRPEGSTGEVYKTFNKKVILIPSKNKGKGNYGPVSLMNIDQKIFNKILGYQCQR